MSLAAKIDAFETATATANQGDLLRLQGEILAAATQAESVLDNDQSPQAAALRTAIGSARASASGDLGKIDGARADLSRVSGEAVPASTAVAKPIIDIKGFSSDLDRTVAAFQGALQRNNTASILRLQKSLADQADQAEASLKAVQSKPAQQVLAAVGAIRAAFAGDTNTLADARVQLQAVNAPAAVVSPVTKPGFDPQAIGGGVRDKATSLQDALRDPHQSADEITKRRDALNEEVSRARAALQDIDDPRADALRAALTAAREAAAGDDAKIDSALSSLQAALREN
jgi:hypothetical protein